MHYIGCIGFRYRRSGSVFYCLSLALLLPSVFALSSALLCHAMPVCTVQEKRENQERTRQTWRHHQISNYRGILERTIPRWRFQTVGIIWLSTLLMLDVFFSVAGASSRGWNISLQSMHDSKGNGPRMSWRVWTSKVFVRPSWNQIYLLQLLLDGPHCACVLFHESVPENMFLTVAWSSFDCSLRQRHFNFEDGMYRT